MATPQLHFDSNSPAKIHPGSDDDAMNVQEAIADFLRHGQSVRNLSDRTLRAYNSDLSQFHLQMNGENSETEPVMTAAADITPQDLEDYLVKLGTGPYRDTSIR